MVSKGWVLDKQRASCCDDGMNQGLPPYGVDGVVHIARYRSGDLETNADDLVTVLIDVSTH